MIILKVNAVDVLKYVLPLKIQDNTEDMHT